MFVYEVRGLDRETLSEAFLAKNDLTKISLTTHTKRQVIAYSRRDSL